MSDHQKKHVLRPLLPLHLHSQKTAGIPPLWEDPRLSERKRRTWNTPPPRGKRKARRPAECDRGKPRGTREDPGRTKKKPRYPGNGGNETWKPWYPDDWCTRCGSAGNEPRDGTAGMEPKRTGDNAVRLGKPGKPGKLENPSGNQKDQSNSFRRVPRFHDSGEFLRYHDFPSYSPFLRRLSPRFLFRGANDVRSVFQVSPVSTIAFICAKITCVCRFAANRSEQSSNK